MSCTPTMDSFIQVLNPDGTVNPPMMQDGNLSWKWILPNSTIKYKVITKPDGYNLGRDEANFQIWCNNKEYLLQQSDRTYARATTEKQEIYLQEIIDVSSGKAEDTPLLSKATMDELDMDRLAVLVKSENFNTNDKGIYEGTYKIPHNSTIGQYAFIISYGYDEGGKQGHNERQKKLTKQIIIATLIAIAIICLLVLVWQIIAAVALTLTGVGGAGAIFSGSVAGTIATALGASAGVAGVAGGVGMVTEYVFYDWLEKEHDATGQFLLLLYGVTDYPTTGKNNSGCEFAKPDGELGPIVHTYGAVICPLIEFDDGGEPTNPPLFSDNMKSALVVLATVATATILIGGKGID